jgi:hypothetical protein
MKWRAIASVISKPTSGLGLMSVLKTNNSNCSPKQPSELSGFCGRSRMNAGQKKAMPSNTKNGVSKSFIAAC